MGYETEFKLDVKVPDTMCEHPDKLHIIKQLFKTVVEARTAIDCTGNTFEATKWYDCDAELSAFSKRFPKVLFELTGHGEDKDDFWRLYVINGKTQIQWAIITFPPYNPKLNN